MNPRTIMALYKESKMLRENKRPVLLQKYIEKGIKGAVDDFILDWDYRDFYISDPCPTIHMGNDATEDFIFDIGFDKIKFEVEAIEPLDVSSSGMMSNDNQIKLTLNIYGREGEYEKTFTTHAFGVYDTTLEWFIDCLFGDGIWVDENETNINNLNENKIKRNAMRRRARLSENKLPSYSKFTKRRMVKESEDYIIPNQKDLIKEANYIAENFLYLMEDMLTSSSYDYENGDEMNFTLGYAPSAKDYEIDDFFEEYGVYDISVKTYPSDKNGKTFFHNTTIESSELTENFGGGLSFDELKRKIAAVVMKHLEKKLGAYFPESRSNTIRSKRRMVKESKRLGSRRMIRESEEDFIYEDDIDDLIWEIAGEAAQRLKESFVDMMEDGEYVEEDEDGNKRMFEQIHISGITYHNNKIPQVLNDLLVDIGLAYINVDFVAYEDDERTGNAIIWNTDEGGMSPELSYQIEEEIDYTSIGSLERVFYDFINDLLFKEDDKEHIFHILMPREEFEESRKCKKVARSLKEAKMKKLIRARKH